MNRFRSMKALPPGRARLFAPAALVFLTLTTGCQKYDIRSYQVPKEAVPVASVHPPVMPPTPPPAAVVEVPHWQLPQGWTEQPGSGMRFATLVAEPGDPPLEVRVTPLNQAARDLLDNVNRWRGQIGLPPVMATEVGALVKTLDANGRPIDFVSMTGPAGPDGPARQILAGILPGNEQVWFFLMFDEARRVAPHTKEFESFLTTVHLVGHPATVSEVTGGQTPPAGTPAAAPPTGASTTGGAGGMTWTLPAGWTPDPTPRDMRVATLRSPGGAEVAITRFAGPGGDLLANINRWRNQLGLSPVASPAAQPGESLNVAGRATQLIDISEAGDTPGRKRTMVVGLTDPEANWFIKMTGAHDALTKDEPAFRQFLASVRMAGGGAR